MAGEIGDLFVDDGNDYVLRSSNDICLRVDSDITVEVATVRVFAVGHVYILDDLRQLAKSFGLAWQFCTTQYGRSITCNRANRKSSYSSLGIRRSTSISCGCKWSIRFLHVVKYNNKSSDPVVITRATPTHSDTCDLLNIDQLVLCRSRSGAYPRCGDEVLKEIMVQVDINPYVSVRLPERKDVDRHMINNVRIRARRRKLELESKSIRIDPIMFDSSFIKFYVSTANNY